MKKFSDVEEFRNFLNTLCLTDRQKKIAFLKYLRGWANVDIAESVGISRRTATEELSYIREAMGKAEIND